MIKHAVERSFGDLEVFYKTKIPDSIIHMHNTNELFLVTDGVINYYIDDEFHRVEKGDLIFIKENQVHGPSPTVSHNVSRGYLHFSSRYVDQLSDSATNIMELFNNNLGIKKLNEHQFEYVKNLILKMKSENEKPSAFGHHLLMKSYLAELLVYGINCTNEDLEEEKELEGPTHSILSLVVKESMDYILEHLNEPTLSLESIAQEISYNKNYLNRKFKKEVGTTLYQYIIINRVSKAKDLMKQGVQPQECAFLCGFSNYSSFYRTFLKQAQMSPSDYVKNYCD